MLQSGSEEGAPHRRLAIFSFRLRSRKRFDTIGLCITRPAAGGNIEFLKAARPVRYSGGLGWGFSVCAGFEGSDVQPAIMASASIANSNFFIATFPL